ncbi:MAG: VanZ family protein [Bowdeniella nasicola]|nr:VanZ family protein [Bowdeniella nasicola]
MRKDESRCARWRCRLALALLGVYAIAAAFLFFWPSGSKIHRLNLDVWLWLRARGLPLWVAPEHVEQVANTLVFALPVAALVFAFPRGRPLWWIIGGMAVSATIETTQALVLPGRQMDWWDFVFNSLGTIVGVITGRYLARRPRWAGGAAPERSADRPDTPEKKRPQ